MFVIDSSADSEDERVPGADGFTNASQHIFDQFPPLEQAEQAPLLTTDAPALFIPPELADPDSIEIVNPAHPRLLDQPPNVKKILRQVYKKLGCHILTRGLLIEHDQRHEAILGLAVHAALELDLPHMAARLQNTSSDYYQAFYRLVSHPYLHDTVLMPLSRQRTESVQFVVTSKPQSEPPFLLIVYHCNGMLPRARLKSFVRNIGIYSLFPKRQVISSFSLCITTEPLSASLANCIYASSYCHCTAMSPLRYHQTR